MPEAHLRYMRLMLFLFLGFIFFLGCVQSPNTIPTPNPGSTLNPTTVEFPAVCIQEKCVHVQLARTEAEKKRGLMGVTSLTNEEGMLFIWEEEGIYPFWMKDTLIPLDIIWIDADGTIIDIASLQPCEADPCPAYTPQGSAQYVLETNVGLMQQWETTIGEEARIIMNAQNSQETN